MYLTHKIICGDCIEVLDGMDRNIIDSVITDPPYGINYYSNYYKQKNPYKRIVNDDQLFFPIEKVRRIVKDTGCIFFFFSWKNPPNISLKNKIIWVKNNWSAGDLKGDFGNQYEEIGFISMSRFKLKGKRISNVWFCNRKKPEFHPTEKPIKLIERMILLTTDTNDIIMDPFIGSGTTLVAAERLGRNSIGIEISEEYCEITYERLKKEVMQSKFNREKSIIKRIGF